MSLKPESPKSKASLLALAGMGMQMLVTILVFAYIGNMLDERSDTGEGNWMLILTLTGVLVSLYFLIKAMLRVSGK